MDAQEQYTVSMQIMAGQRNAAHDQLVMVQVQNAMLQAQVQALTEQLKQAQAALPQAATPSA